MTIERVEDLKSEPVVGQHYIVPCVQVKAPEDLYPLGFWPVIGPKHEDGDIVGFEPHHWHFDFRFFDAEQMAFVRSRKGMLTVLVQEDEQRFWGVTKHYPRPGIGKAPVRKRRVCNYAMPGWPCSSRMRPIKRDSVGWLQKLEAAYADKRVTCGKCPHRGLPLESLPKDADGNTVCVGHGLKFNLSTGKMVRR